MARVAAWLMNEGEGTTAAEYGGNSALNFLLNGCTLGASGIDFSGSTTDYAEIPAANNAALRIATPFTIATRITTPASVPYLQFYHATDANLNGLFSGSHLITNGSGNLEFMYGNNTGSSSAGRRSWVAGVLAPNTTYDLVAVCTDASGGTTGVTLYVNGVAVSTTTSGTGGAMVYTNHPTTVGRWIRGGRDSAHIMRYLAVYDHAFTPEEVAAITADYIAFITGGTPSGRGALLAQHRNRRVFA